MIRRPLTSPLFPYTTLFRSIDFGAFVAIIPRSIIVSLIPFFVEIVFNKRGAFILSRNQHIQICIRAFLYIRSEEHTSELQSRPHLVCRLLLEKKNKNKNNRI